MNALCRAPTPGLITFGLGELEGPGFSRHTFLIAGVLEEVVLQHPHEDGGQEAREQQHRHARVDDAEPVDLRCREAQGSGLAGIEAGWLRRWKEDARVDEV